MRAFGIKAFGGAGALQSLDIEAVAPLAGEVRVKVMFAGVNAVDVHARSGNFLGAQAPGGPMVLGYEGAGEIEAVGDGVGGLRPGDRVAWCGIPGSLAEYQVMPAWRAVPVPDHMPLDIACALQLDGALAHALTVSAFPVRGGDQLLIQGAETVSGQLLVQVAKSLGATVIATVGRDEIAAMPLAIGADHVVVRSGGTVVSQVEELTAGRYCNGVFDGVGEETITASIDCCRRRGAVLLHGAQGQPVASISPDQLAAAGSIFLTRVHLPDYMQDQTEVHWRISDVFNAWQQSHLKVSIARIVALEAAGDAFDFVEHGGAMGKALVRI
ncbi:MAG: zinc-binding dehydrogenase [Hyphomicrobiaceae bacterium]